MSEVSLVSHAQISTQDVEVYPNPAHNQLAIKLQDAEGALVQLISQNGVSIAQSHINNGIAQFTVNHLPRGIYTFQLQTNMQTVTVRVVLE